MVVLLVVVVGLSVSFLEYVRMSLSRSFFCPMVAYAFVAVGFSFRMFSLS